MISTSLVPIRRDLDLLFREDFSPAAHSEFLAATARKIFAAVDAVNEDAMGQPVPSVTYVDGRVSDAFERVRPDGSIVRVYELMPLALQEIGNMLWDFSPVKSGAYQASHRLLADGSGIAEVTEGWLRQHCGEHGLIGV
jgi:hypothetical protein